MTFFRYEADRIPVLCIVVLSALDVVVYLYATSLITLTAWLVLLAVPKMCICSWNHHHQHLLTFKQTWLNRLLEIVYAFHTGLTTNSWVLHHVLGHHVNYLDQARDESAWKRPDGTTMGTVEYTVTVAATAHLRAFQVGRRFRQYLASFLGMGLVVTLILGLFFYFNWLNALMVFLLPMLVGYVVTVWHTYYHHSGLDTDDHFQASYNIMDHWYNVATGNLGYHTAHHVKPGLHWSLLPAYHATIADKIPANLYRNVCIPFKWIPNPKISSQPKVKQA